MFCTFFHPPQQRLENVQASQNILLDNRGNQPDCVRWWLEQPLMWEQMPFHLIHTGILCSIRRHCQQEPQHKLHVQSHTTWSPMLLWLPDRSRKIHNKMYSLLIDAYVKCPFKKAHLLHAITTIPCVQEEAKWALTWCDPMKFIFSEWLVAFAAVKGVFFLGSFYAIFWLKKCRLMHGLSLSNELICHNGELHCKFVRLLYSKLDNLLMDNRITKIISSAVDIKTTFITSWTHWHEFDHDVQIYQVMQGLSTNWTRMRKITAIHKNHSNGW